MSNVHQQTNFDLTGDIILKQIESHGTTLRDVPYRTIIFDKISGEGVSKFGYCVNDNQGINYPIFICFSNEDTSGEPFQIGKTGMFEIQKEELPNVSETENPDIEVKVYKILVCTRVPFVIDYYI